MVRDHCKLLLCSVIREHCRHFFSLKQTFHKYALFYFYDISHTFVSVRNCNCNCNAKTIFSMPLNKLQNNWSNYFMHSWRYKIKYHARIFNLYALAKEKFQCIAFRCKKALAILYKTIESYPDKNVLPIWKPYFNTTCCPMKRYSAAGNTKPIASLVSFPV